jgi:hypothetical protein
MLFRILPLTHPGGPANTLSKSAPPCPPLIIRVPDQHCVSRMGLEREENNSVAIASNESFGGWTKTFTDPRLCAAIVDRLTFGGNILETGTDSYRLAHTRAQQAASS